MMKSQFIAEVQLDNFDDGTYISNLPVVKCLRKIKSLELAEEITFFVGENGTGKSTLIEAIAVAAGFNAEGGSKNFNFSTRNSTSKLFRYIRLVKRAYEKDGYFLRAESYYNLSTQVDELGLDIGRYGGVSLHEVSHGESFMALIQNRFSGNGLYILDGPSQHYHRSANCHF